MARLNDPAPTLDAVETLKRRFIRQNREIARVNSTQSVRIRNLETEISRLLAENLAVREQAINIAQKAHRARKTCSRCSQLTGIKNQLEVKLSEISAVVSGLDILHKDRQSSSPGRRRSSGLQLFSLAGQDGTNFGGAEKPAKQTQEGWMPPILEDKRYPRRTLEAEELRATIPLGEENSESPDLGPPPVAHFDVGEVSKFDPQPAGSAGSEDETMALPPNLERRRKRRASAFLGDLSEPGDRLILKEPAVTIRSAAGAKRKLSVRDDNESDSTTKAGSEIFPFSRSKSTSTTRDSASEHKVTSQKPTNEQQSLEISPRKALQPKTTNSPTKSRRPTMEDKLAALKEDVARQGEARRLLREKRAHKAPSTIAKATEKQEPAPQEDDPCEVVDLPPTTPANLDAFTPSSAEPPTSRTDAPAPEIQAMPSVEDIVSNASRPSRRPRGAVSYAEPNLRDKMRRPTKELAPAVCESDRFQRAASVKGESDSDIAVTGEKTATEKPKMRTVVVKRENHSMDGEWKELSAAGDEAASPLIGKKSNYRGERGHPEPSTDEAMVARTSALVTERSDDDPRPPGPSPKDASLDGALSKLSVFDGPASSPSSPVPKTDAAPEEKSSIKPSSRRHSSNPAGIRRVGSDFSHIQRQPMSKKRETRPEVPARPSSAMERREAAAKSAKLARSGSMRNFEGHDRDREKGNATLTAAGDAVRRGERTVARRRSMMI